MKFEISHTFRNIDVDRYIKLFFDETFNEAMKPIAGLKSRELLEKKDEPGFMVERQEGEGRSMRYTVRGYAAGKPEGQRYGA